MKLIFISILGLFLVISCTSSETPQEEKDNGSMVEVPVVEDSIEENSVTSKLANQWVLVNRTNTKKDKEVEFSNDNSFIVTQFETNGFFSVYDLIKTGSQESDNQTLTVRSSGQWEVHNENELVMRHSYNNSSKIDAYIIETLDDDNLVIRNSEKDIIDTYTRKK